MDTSSDLTVRFCGVRGSYPTPGSSTVRYGDNIACVEVEAGGCSIILDAGSGIIGLGQSLMRETDVLLVGDAQFTEEHYLGLLPGISVTHGQVGSHRCRVFLEGLYKTKQRI
jgi:hypothetical protein